MSDRSGVVPPIPERTPWDDVRDLAASVGQEVHFEPQAMRRPPLVCRPVTEYAWDEDGTASTFCAVHGEVWPCAAFREGRGVQEQTPEVRNVLTFRPVEDDRG